MSNRYHSRYFNSVIFDFDYEPIASAIYKEYAPKTIIEFGCGNGQLSKAFAAHPVSITALDGYANPDFEKFPGIQFHKVDLNNPGEVESFLQNPDRRFDVAICMEVAEHLNPAVSGKLIEWMTGVADVVVFSAAVPEQDGDGHINCQSRLFWHSLFEENNFHLRDTIRGQIRELPKVAKWYALNTVDYVRNTGPVSLEEYRQLVTNLIGAESEAASSFYYANRRADLKDRMLGLPIVKGAFRLRNFVKKVIGQKALSTEL